MDDSTTGAAPDSAGAQALPDAQVTTPPADSSPNHAPEPSQQGGEPVSLPHGADEETVKFAQAHGLELDSPNAVKAAKIAKDNQAEFQRAQQKASQLDKSLQTQQQPQQGIDPTMQEFIADYRRDKMLNQFKESTPDWKEHEPVMVEKLSEVVSTPYGNYSRSDLVNAGLLSLNDVYAMAKGSVQAPPQENVTDVLQSIANKQQAGSVQGNAINSAPPANVTDDFLEGVKRNRSA